MAYLFALMPFAVEKHSEKLMYMNRSLFFAVGAIVFIAIGMKKIKVENYAYILLFGIYTLIQVCIFAVLIDNGNFSYSFFKWAQFIIAALLFIWSRYITYEQRKLLAYLIIAITLFYSTDAIIQYVIGVDIFGYKDKQRSWGAFVYGAPPLGFLISMMFFVPIYYLKNKMLLISTYFCLLLALLLAQDRASILQVMIAIFAALIIKGYIRYAIILFSAGVGFFYLYQLSDTYRIAMLINASAAFVGSGFDLDVLVANNELYSLGEYVKKYEIIIEFLLSKHDPLAVIFGVGFGASDSYLSNYLQAGRTHWSYLQYFVEFGVIGVVVAVMLIFRIIARKEILLLPLILPSIVLQYSSFNNMLIILVLLMLLPESRNNNRENAWMSFADNRNFIKNRIARPVFA
jgi:O-antigen ligase